MAYTSCNLYFLLVLTISSRLGGIDGRSCCQLASPPTSLSPMLTLILLLTNIFAGYLLYLSYLEKVLERATRTLFSQRMPNNRKRRLFVYINLLQVRDRGQHIHSNQLSQPLNLPTSLSTLDLKPCPPVILPSLQSSSQ